jgi:FMN phosphatase YigB (HAD superfamily)
MTSRRIEALVFDLGGVIVDHDNAVMHRRLASSCRAGWSLAQIAVATGDSRWGTGRPVTELHEELTRDAGYEGDWDTFVDDWCCHLVLNPSMLAFVENLAARHRVMIFSNTNAQHWEFGVRASEGRLTAFDPVLSYEIGHAKPSPRSFEIVAERARARPSALLFFDDVAANVEGARRAGFQAEVFEGEERLRALLSSVLGSPFEHDASEGNAGDEVI